MHIKTINSFPPPKKKTQVINLLNGSPVPNVLYLSHLASLISFTRGNESNAPVFGTTLELEIQSCCI